MHQISLQMLSLLCVALSACTSGGSTPADPRGDLQRNVDTCRADHSQLQRDEDCTKAIAERDKAAWRSQGRGIQIKPEARP